MDSWGNKLTMADMKTQQTDADVLEFINSFADTEQKRKAAISLYDYTGAKEHEYLLNGLGKYKTGKACIYVKKLSDINQDVLKMLAKETINFLQSKYK